MILRMNCLPRQANDCWVAVLLFPQRKWCKRSRSMTLIKWWTCLLYPFSPSLLFMISIPKVPKSSIFASAYWGKAPASITAPRPRFTPGAEAKRNKLQELLRGVEASGWDEADIPLHCPMKMGLIYIWLYMYRYNIVIVIIFYLLNLLYYMFIFTYIYIFIWYICTCIYVYMVGTLCQVVPWCHGIFQLRFIRVLKSVSELLPSLFMWLCCFELGYRQL